MYTDVFKKYFQNFKFILPFILVELAFDVATFETTGNDIGTDKYGFMTKGDFFGNIRGDIISLIMNNIVIILIILFVTPLFYAFLQLVMKSIIREEEVNYRESFRESLGFYFRYLGLSIIIIAIVLGILLLSFFAIMLPILLIGIVILLVYIGITITPCGSYLIYYDTSPEEALSEGRKLGKKYFWSIFLVGLISGIINAIIKVKPEASLLTYSIITFITITIQYYMYMFTINICRKEEPLLDDGVQSTEDNWQ